MAFGRGPMLVLALLLGCALGTPARAVSEADAERLEQFALLLGRGIACDLDTGRASAAIGRWVEQTFPKGSPDREGSLEGFARSVRFHAARQQGGESPDDCADITAAFKALQW